MYNDEPPIGKTDGYRGHTKGVLSADSKSGFWLIHSVPHYPPDLLNGSYSYAATGLTYAQNFLCITMNSGEIDKSAVQLMYNEPHIYSSAAPSELK